MINMVALMGRLTYQPELKSTPSGVPVIRFQVACERTYQAQGKERQADFIDCVAWRNTAEFINRYFNKGSMIAIEGTIQTSNYTDKNGQTRKQVEILVNQAHFCGAKTTNNANLNVSPDDAEFEEFGTDDDLPF